MPREEERTIVPIVSSMLIGYEARHESTLLNYFSLYLPDLQRDTSNTLKQISVIIYKIAQPKSIANYNRKRSAYSKRRVGTNASRPVINIGHRAERAAMGD